MFFERKPSANRSIGRGPRGVQFQCRDRKLDFLAKVATKISQTAIWCSHLITQTQPKVILDQPKVILGQPKVIPKFTFTGVLEVENPRLEFWLEIKIL